ncbi:MAG: RNA methyltransferase substrate-binding domain-containing protein, partial [Candidatus Omnitrophica bacterium]|nr:RNA methyltransferase substrate-binding domain-containing protein [Candidatus Omnitrophota bacterium]
MRLFGRRSIIERIKTKPKTIKRIYLQEGLSRPEVTNLARKHNVYFEILPTHRFLQLAQKAHAQGVIAEVTDFEYSDFDDIIAEKSKPTLICLDRINDPQNLGVILRNCACFGGFCVVLPRHESVEVTEASIKVASGAENYVPVCLVTNLS